MIFCHRNLESISTRRRRLTANQREKGRTGPEKAKKVKEVAKSDTVASRRWKKEKMQAPVATRASKVSLNRDSATKWFLITYKMCFQMN